MSYQSIKTAIQFLELLRTLYLPPKNKIVRLVLRPMKFLTISGKGSPEAKAFQAAIQLIYGIAFTLKFGLKFDKLAKPKGWFDYKVSALEGLWWAQGGMEKAKKEQFQWKLFILQPSFVTAAEVTAAVKLAAEKRPLAYSRVKLETWAEGDAIQMLHIGPYDKEKATTEKLVAYAASNKLKITGRHHEIYLSDPRRTPAAKLKTVIRYGVNK